MPYHPLLLLPDEGRYRQHFLQQYCARSPLTMHDGMMVRFFADAFDHAFLLDTDRHGRPVPPVFSSERAERMRWIAACLADVALPSFRRVMPDGDVRRLVLVPAEPYVVVLRVVGAKRAKFLTAYVVNSQSALGKIMGNPTW